MKKDLMPTGFRVLVRLQKVKKAKDKYQVVDGNYEERTETGIVLAVKKESEVVKEEIREQAATQDAVVVAMGPTAFKFDDQTPWCHVGDHVIIAKYATGVDMKDGDDTYRIINDQDIFATYTPETGEGL